MISFKTTKIRPKPFSPQENEAMQRDTSIAALVFKHQQTAINAVVSVLENDSTPPALKLKAAAMLLDMGERIYDRLSGKRVSDEPSHLDSLTAQYWDTSA